MMGKSNLEAGRWRDPHRAGGRTRRVIEGLGASYLSLAVKTALRLVVTPFYLARLGPELLGFNAFVRETINYFQIMDFGVSHGLSAIVAKDLQPGATEPEVASVRKRLRAGGQIQLFFAAVVIVSSVGLALVIDVIAQGLPADHVVMARVCTVAFGVAFALQLSSGVFSALLKGAQLIAQNSLYSLGAAVITTIVSVVLVHEGWMLYGLATGAVVAGSILLWQVRWRSRRLGMDLQVSRGPIEWGGMRDVAVLSAWVVLGSIGALLSFGSARIILGITPSQGMTSVNQFSLLAAIPMIIRIQANRIPVTVRPGLTQLAHDHSEGEQAQKVGRLMIRISGLVAATSFIGILYVNGSFVTRWVGGEYFAGEEANYLIATLTGLAIWMFGFKVLMEVQFRFAVRGIGLFGAGVLSLIISLMLVSSLGIVGVLVGAIVSEAVVGAVVFLPAGFRWLCGEEVSIAGILHMIWMPVAAVVIAILVKPRFPQVPPTWSGVLIGTTSVGIIMLVSGFLWLRRDLQEYFPLFRKLGGYW